MTVDPITVELYDAGQILYGHQRKNSNIENMQTVPCVTVSVSVEGICPWITSKGGWANLAVFDIMTLVSSYLGQTNIGFSVSIAHIMGGVAYYLDNMPSGNSLTGCSFT